MTSLSVNEKFLYEIWKNQEFDKPLITQEKEKIIVIDAGSRNAELGGPDFKNARIKIGNITYQGDVEIDLFHSDWKNHGHFLNKKYNKTILHVVLNNDSKENYVLTQDGRKVQSVLIESLIKNDFRSEIQKAIISERESRLNNKMPCNTLNSSLNKKEKLSYIFDLGFVRFRHKREKVLQRLKELTYLAELNLKEPIISYDIDENFNNRKFVSQDFSKKEIWLQLIYELVFEALGYSMNKDIMRRLAESVDINFLIKYRNEENFIEILESILFGAAGLLPEVEKLPDSEISEYTKNIFRVWNNIKKEYNGRTFHSANWQFFKLRPQNFPTVRIAGGVQILNKLLKENLVEKIIEIFKLTNNPRRLSSELRNLFLIKASGFWKKHYVFDQIASSELKYFIGMSRADEIIINVILPLMSIYFDVFNKHDLAKKVLKLYLNYYQIGNNNITIEVTNTLGLDSAAKRTVFNQGMIELYKEFCMKQKCLECNIGKKIFA